MGLMRRYLTGLGETITSLKFWNLNGWLVIGLGVLSLLVMLNISPYKQPVPATDSSVFLYIGELILEGKIPYVDAWDHKGPIVFFINALGQLLRRDSMWGVWLLEVVFVGSAAVLGFFALRKIFGKWPALLASSLWLIALPRVLDGGNLAELYALPFQFAVLLCLVLFDEQKESKYIFWLGVFTAAAFWLRANLIGISLVVGTFLMALVWREEKRRVSGALGKLALGFFSLSVLILGYFFLKNALLPMLDATLSYNFFYIQGGSFSAWKTLTYGFALIGSSPLFIFAGAGWLLCVSVLAFSTEKKPKIKRFLLLILVALPLDFFLVALSGNNYVHYYMTLFPALAINVAFFWSVVINGFSAGNDAFPAANLHRSRMITLGLLLSILISYSSTTIKPAVDSLNAALGAGGVPPVSVSESKSEPIFEYISNELSPGQPIVVWGNDLSINWLSGHNNPTRFIYQTPLFNPGYVTEEMVSEFIEDLERSRPIIIDATKRRTHLAAAVDSPLENVPEILRPLYRYMHENYLLVESLTPQKFPVYEYITVSDASWDSD